MPPIKFSVSEVRVAATCPRITYFDAENTRRNRLKTRAMTRIWKAGAEETACGSLFHHTIEDFNRRAYEAPEIRKTLNAAPPDPRAIEQRLRAFLNTNCVDLDTLATKSAIQQSNFIRAIGIYMGELADIVGDARHRGKPSTEIIEHLFGDRRRRVNVTFQVGPNGEPVQVTGVLDYVFHDWRSSRQRIIDYKLTPAGEPSNDLFQISLYALMHHVQHRTEPDVGVLYLHPERRMVELTWDQVHAQRRKLFDLLASMASWVEYDEVRRLGVKPPGEPSYCSLCRWDKDNQCVRRLGPKHEGRRLDHWSSSEAGGTGPEEPPLDVGDPAASMRSWVQESIEESTGEAPEDAVATAPIRPRAVGSEAPSKHVPDNATPVPSHTPDTGSLQIGATIHGQRPVEIPLPALPTHVAVVGAAGSGKTYLAKVIVEEAIRQGIPVLAVDPQGDLVQFLRPAEDPTVSPTLQHLRRAYQDRVEPRVWTPGTSHGRRICLDPIRLARLDELDGETDPRRRTEEWENLLSLTAGQLVGLCKVGRDSDSQKTFLFQVLRSLAAGSPSERRIDLATLASASIAPDSVGLNNPDLFIKKSEREKLARKLNGLRLGPSAGLFTGGEQLDLDMLLRPGTTGRTPLNVVYLNALADEDQKHSFLAALAAEIYRWMMTSSSSSGSWPRLLFYIDEARDTIPAGASKPPAKEPLIRLFTQGRKFGVACLLCTQSPRSVDHNVFGNCSTKLIGRLESAQDQERVAEWFTNDGARPSWLSGRSGAEAGSFLGRWPGMPEDLEGTEFRSRPLFSLHQSAWAPDRLEREVASQLSRANAPAGRSVSHEGSSRLL